MAPHVAGTIPDIIGEDMGKDTIEDMIGAVMLCACLWIFAVCVLALT